MKRFSEECGKVKDNILVVIKEQVGAQMIEKQSLSGLWNNLKFCADWIRDIEKKLSNFYPEYIADDRGITIDTAGDYSKFFYEAEPFRVSVQIYTNPLFNNDQFSGTKSDTKFLELINLIRDTDFNDAKVEKIKYDTNSRKIIVLFVKHIN